MSIEGGIPGHQQRLVCPNCGKVFFAWRPDELPGQKIKCYFCRHEFADEAALRPAPTPMPAATPGPPAPPEPVAPTPAAPAAETARPAPSEGPAQEPAPPESPQSDTPESAS